MILRIYLLLLLLLLLLFLRPRTYGVVLLQPTQRYSIALMAAERSKLFVNISTPKGN